MTSELMDLDGLEDRDYQTSLASDAAKANTLLVLPTGLGKTVIACMVIAQRLSEVGGRALFLAPSRPLVDQHATTLESVLKLGTPSCLTGSEPWKKRSTRWRASPLIVATPQVAINDLQRGFVPSDITVVVFDEAHRAVGRYAYAPLAAGLRERCPELLVLGLTASPGHEIEHIEEVADNLGIEEVILRSRDDPDVAPYVEESTLEWIEVEPSQVILKVSKHLTKFLYERLNQLRKYGFLRNRKNRQVRIQDLTEARGQIFARRKGGGQSGYLFQASSQLSLAQMALHAISCIERQGVDAFLKFVEPKTEKAGRKRVDASFVNDKRVTWAINAARRWRGPSHPKVPLLLEVVSQEVRRKSDAKVIVFAELRDTVNLLVELLQAEGVKASRFTGQGSRQGRKGMTQKQQQKTLRRFEGGEFNVLCATSIGEEGLDVPQVDLVVFYEPVASEVRLIQRRGRTGRDAPGKTIIFTTDRTLDERYLWSGFKREKRMERMVRGMAANASKKAARKRASGSTKPSGTKGKQLAKPGPRQTRLVHE